jgi:cell division protein FtsN
MARGGFARRRRPMSVKTIAIIVGVVIVVLVGVVFWAAGQADSRRPAQSEITVPATNIGPNAPAPGAAENAPAQ